MLKIDKNKKYLLACSNGPDSMALFYLLLKENFDFEVAHVNYHIREDSNNDENILREFCKNNNIILHVYNNEKKIVKNVEEECREIRYNYFQKIIDDRHLDALLVAHHMDDHIETYLLQKNRKIIPNCYGLSEFSMFNDYEIIRPLLAYTKDELKQICDKNSIPYSIDYTNLDDMYERNKIRHNIIEKMTAENKKEFINKIFQENEALNNSKKAALLVEDGKISNIIKLSDIELFFYLTNLTKNVCIYKEISLVFVKEIRKKLLSKKSNIIIPYFDKYYFCKEYDYFCLRLFDQENYKFGMEVPTIIDSKYFYADFSKDYSNRNIKDNDFPITIRNAKLSDKYMINGYSCSLRRLFIDWKMPIYYRKFWPVILNKDGKIIYVPRYQANFDKNLQTNFFVK